MNLDDYTIVYRGVGPSGVFVAEDGERRNLYMDGYILQSSMLQDDPSRLCLVYCQAMMCSLLFQPQPERVLLIGLGGGTLRRADPLCRGR